MTTKMSTQDFEKKYYQYKDILFRIAFTYVKNMEDCEDILQEVFIKYLSHADELENEEHEKRWLIRITVNLCKNHVTSFWNRKKTTYEEIPEFGLNDNGQEILKEVLALPAKYKAIVYLFYFEGYKCREIAEMLHLKESAVKMRLKKARELLRLELVEERGRIPYETTGIRTSL